MLRSLEFQNRFILLAMSRYNSPQGVPGEDLLAFHIRRAKSRVPFQFTGASAVDKPAANNHPDLADFRPDTYDDWRRVVDATLEAGGLRLEDGSDCA